MAARLERKLLLGDCLERMATIAAGSVDLILADLPYGSTKCGWDQRIDLDRFWPLARRVLTDRGAVVLFADMRFASTLINSQPKWFRYDLVWDKVAPVGFLDSNRRPLRSHELMLVFGRGNPRFRPQHWMSDQGAYAVKSHSKRATSVYSGFGPSKRVSIDGSRYPVSIVRVSNANGRHKGKIHPTQKPVKLMTWLIKTYTDEAMTVLDPTMGSGSTGLACVETGRSFVGIEMDPSFYAIARTRIKSARRLAEPVAI